MIQKISVVALSESETKKAFTNSVAALLIVYVCVAFFCQQPDTYAVYR